MSSIETRTLELTDVAFATAGPRRLTRPYVTSVSANKSLVRFLGWMLQSGGPDPGKWHQRHLAGAVSPSADYVSGAARKFIDLAASVLAERDEALLQAVRARAINCYARDRQLKAVMMRYPRWKPEVEVTGAVPHAVLQAEKRPIVYWADNTVFAEFLGRMALHQLGVRSTQFSDHVHGDGHTWLGKLTAQRMNFALENRYTASRIVSGPTTHFNAIRKLAKSARTHTALFMTNNAFIGRRFACTRLDDQLCFVQATAPLTMTRTYNAAVVPLTVLETEPFQRFSVRFHKPLEADMNLSRDDDIRRMALLSTQRQMSEIRENPEQWLCWTSGQFAQPADGKIHRAAM
ncbi:hypothetical protein [Anderseniella sp. Alg231-50]|uniref:hypothetical protein n=1 Tax=Anderseniella sp. Alg231-50 TaxID=1922226 RepID=UPI000D54DF6F